MQDTEGKPIKLNGKHVEFTTKDFTATNFASAEDKAKWANKFTKFILGGFQRSAFKKEIYKQLQHMFGHCAEYDINGFYYTWFEDTHRCLHWVETVTTTWLALVSLNSRGPMLKSSWPNGSGKTTSTIRLQDICKQRPSRKSARRSGCCRIDTV